MRVSSKVYYGYTGRLKDNKGKSSKSKISTIPTEPPKKFSECSCTKMIRIIDNIFVNHEDMAGLPCNGSGETKNFWKY